MEIITLTVGPLDTNCYLLGSKNKAIIIDPGAEGEKILEILSKKSLTPEFIVYTHAHWDHTGGSSVIKEKTNPEIILGKYDIDCFNSKHNNLSEWLGYASSAASPDRLVDEDEHIKSSGIDLKVIHTPGHTPGGISLYIEGHLFCGDTIFYGSVGRTDLPGGNTQELTNSIRSKIFCLDDNTLLLPGHGPASTVGQEKLHNPYCPGND